MRVSPWFGAIVAVAIAGSAAAQEDPKALFQARYDTFRSAMAAQDQAAVGAILAPGYTMTDIQGEVRDAAAVAQMMQRMPAALGRDAKTTVLEAAVTGSTAAVKQQLAAKATRPSPDGKEMTMEFEVTSNDTWVKNGDAWQLKASVQKDVVVKRDGEVFFKQSN
ncbi:MAG: nuclear transport factor 2 family protein [Novosphingobium sp.]|jgi:ketosteroid isomerase-like protein